jgi:type IV secretory pathway VirB10-like protein
MSSVPAIEDKDPKPAGLVPKNVQSWILAGLAVVMVLIMWLTGGRKPLAPSQAGPRTPAIPPPLEVNEGKIVELQKRIEALQREQAIAQSALEQQGRVNGGEPGAGAFSSESSERAPSDRQEDPLESERKKRNYLSLFASNVALSYRKQAAPQAQENPTSPALHADSSAAQLAELLKPAQPPLPAAAPAPKNSADHEAKEEPQHPAGAPGVRPAATGKTYVLFEGTVLETILIHRLDGGFAGPIECLLASDVYSHDRQHLLIPGGSKLLGETRRVETFGQTRLAVAFHRLVMPDGYSASLDHFQGLNQIGDAGLRDQVNNHYLRIFGVSLAIGAIGAAAEAGTSAGLTASGTDLMRQGIAESTARSSAQILDRFLNVLPTVTIREGHRVKVYLSGDLALPDYASHTMPVNL